MKDFLNRKAYPNCYSRLYRKIGSIRREPSQEKKATEEKRLCCVGGRERGREKKEEKEGERRMRRERRRKKTKMLGHWFIHIYIYIDTIVWLMALFCVSLSSPLLTHFCCLFLSLHAHIIRRIYSLGIIFYLFSNIMDCSFFFSILKFFFIYVYFILNLFIYLWFWLVMH